LNREAVERLLAAEYQGLLALLRRKTRDPQVAADILNDALVTTLANFDAGRIGDPTHICGYVFQVAMNLLRNHRRKFSERGSAHVEATDDSLVSAATLDHVEENWAQKVRLIIDELPTPRDRALVKRFYLNEEEKDSLCSELELSPLQFDKILFRARKRMQSLLESYKLRKGDFFGVLLVGLGVA